jgi:predicted ferric reductase
VFLIIIFHSYFIYSDLLVNIYLKLYVGIFVVAAIASVIYLILTKANIINKKLYKVVAVNKLSEQVTEIELAPMREAMKYLAGQFVFVSFKSKSISSEAHPFSITSCPDEKTIRITVKNLGDYTSRIHFLKKGDLAYLEGPFGFFSVERYPNNYQLWIAGGIGITPFLSMAQNLRDESLDIYFYYSALDNKGLIGAQSLDRIAHRNPHFHLVYFLFNERGLLTAKILQSEVPNLEKRDIFICGPAKMMSSLRAQLVALNIDDNSIHTEEFSL